MLSEGVKEQNIADRRLEISALLETDLLTPHGDLYTGFDFIDDVAGSLLTTSYRPKLKGSKSTGSSAWWSVRWYPGDEPVWLEAKS